MLKCLLILSLLLLISELSFGENAPSCFANATPFFKNFDRLSASSDEKLAMVQSSCKEIVYAPEYYTANPAWYPVEEAFSTLTMGAFGFGVGAFSRMNLTDNQKQYMAEIVRIKRIQNSMERIRQIYQLVVRTQGTYDHEWSGNLNVATGLVLAWESPENILLHAKLRGTAGVCRDFAALLHWSLLQVTRAAGSQSVALGVNDFSVKYVDGNLPETDGNSKVDGNHSWVRVLLPRFTPQGRLDGFNTFDLDTTFYPDVFTPLFPRRSGVSAEGLAEATRQCDEIVSCLKQ